MKKKKTNATWLGVPVYLSPDRIKKVLFIQECIKKQSENEKKAHK